MKFALKNIISLFFCKVIVGYKRIKEVLKKRMIVKIYLYLGLSLVLLQALWGQFIFR